MPPALPLYEAVQRLIRASGGTPAAGQSFRHHVAGAASGAAVSDYALHAITTYAQPAPRDTGTVHPSGTAATFDFTIEGGSRVQHILRTDEGAVAVQSVLIDPPPADPPPAEFVIGGRGFVTVDGGLKYRVTGTLVLPYRPTTETADVALAFGFTPDHGGFNAPQNVQSAPVRVRGDGQTPPPPTAPALENLSAAFDGSTFYAEWTPQADYASTVLLDCVEEGGFSRVVNVGAGVGSAQIPVPQQAFGFGYTFRVLARHEPNGPYSEAPQNPFTVP